MNRINISPLATASADLQPKRSATSLCKPLQTPFQNEHSLFVPLHYEKGYAYPLIVWLHSDGDDFGQLKRVMPKISLRNYVAVAPNALISDHGRGYHWQHSAEGIQYAHQAIQAAIDYAQIRTNIAKERIYLGGFCGGGTMAFRIALERPDLFAGVASLNGPLPVGQAPMRNWSNCRNLPVFWAHSRKSSQFDEELLCRQLRLLHVAGFSLTLRQYPTADEMADRALADFNRWIMQ